MSNRKEQKLDQTPLGQLPDSSEFSIQKGLTMGMVQAHFHPEP